MNINTTTALYWLMPSNSLIQNKWWPPCCRPLICMTQDIVLGKGQPQCPASLLVWASAGTQEERQLPYGCYWLERQLWELNISNKWMVSNFYHQITMALKWTWYLLGCFTLGNSLLLWDLFLCLLSLIGKLTVTCSLRFGWWAYTQHQSASPDY